MFILRENLNMKISFRLLKTGFTKLQTVKMINLNSYTDHLSTPNLNQFNQTNSPILFSWPLNGKEKTQHLELSFRNINLDGSCSVKHKNTIYFFGGRYNAKQIGKLDECNVVKGETVDLLYLAKSVPNTLIRSFLLTSAP